MSQKKSALENWSKEAPQVPAPKPIAGYLPLVLSAAGALGVAPFAVMRWMTRDWVIASIDTVIVIGFIVLGTYVYRTRQVRAASIAIAALSLLGTIITVYFRGPQQVYWAFPALMAAFYLLKPREAIIVTMAMTVVLLPAVAGALEFFPASTVFITLLVTSAFAYAFSVINYRQQALLIELATKDPLTGAGNRRALESRLTEVVAAFGRSSSPASLIIIDLDNFKAVNDLHGHAVGDQILQRLTQIINLRIRMSDSLYRIGGEEFVVVNDGQQLASSCSLAEQLRTLVEVNELAPESKVTISLGVAELRRDETFAQWLCRADAALYQAKRAGRNTLKCAS